jgi:hypothetical protein
MRRNAEVNVFQLDPSIDLIAECGPPVVRGSWKKYAGSSSNSNPRSVVPREENAGISHTEPQRPSSKSAQPSFAIPKRHPSLPHLALDITRLPTLPTSAAAALERKPSTDLDSWRDDEGDNLTSSDEEFGEDTTPQLGIFEDDGLFGDMPFASGSRFHGKSSCLRCGWYNPLNFKIH